MRRGLEHRLTTAFEEEGDVGVFLGLGNAKLALAGRGHHLAEGPGQVFRREKGGQEGVELGRVFHHSQRAGERRALLPLRSEEHTSELQSLMRISYAVFCLKKKN